MWFQEARVKERECEIGPAGKTANKGCFHKQVITVETTAQCPQGRWASHVASGSWSIYSTTPFHPFLIEACFWRCELPCSVVCPTCEPVMLLWPKNTLGELQVLGVGWPHKCRNAVCHVNQQGVLWWTDSEMTPSSVPDRSIYTLM